MINETFKYWYDLFIKKLAGVETTSAAVADSAYSGDDTLQRFVIAVGYLSSRDDGICICDSTSIIVFVNEPFIKLFGGNTHADFIGIHLSKFIGEGQNHPHDQDMSEMMKGEEKMAFSTAGVVSGVKVAGDEFPVLILDRNMYRVDGELYLACKARPPRLAGFLNDGKYRDD